MNAVVAFAHRDTHRPLNRLERAGWAVLAAERLGVASGEAAVLRELVFAAGRFVCHDFLAECFARQPSRQPARPARYRLSVRVARLRAALEQIGLPRNAIETESSVGYGMAPHFARRVRAIVEGGE